MSNVIPFPDIELTTRSREPLKGDSQINPIEYLRISRHSIFGTVDGDMEDEGIFDGDLVLMDTSLLAERGDVILLGDGDDFLIRVAEFNGQPVKAVATHVIHTLRKEKEKKKVRGKSHKRGGGNLELLPPHDH